MHIGVDIDGVLADLAGHVVQRINNKHNTTYTKEDIHEYYQMLNDISLKDEVKQALLDANFVKSMPMIKDANKVVQELSKDHIIHIITKRSSYTMKETVGWLIDHSIPFRSCIISEYPNKPINHIDILIDDNEENIIHAINKGKKGILFLQPYNINSELRFSFSLRKEEEVLCTNNWIGVHGIIKYWNEQNLKKEI